MKVIEKQIRNSPDVPGVYIFKGKKGKILYIGKAKSLKKRLANYLRPDTWKEKKFTSLAVRLELIPLNNETEALILESNLIKKEKPQYNIRLKDDKSFKWIKITKEEIPRVMVTRRVSNDGAKYFGPYPDGMRAKTLYSLLLTVFRLRSCKKIQKKPCLYFHIGKCSAPCSSEIISKKDYAEKVKDAVRFLEGDTKEVIRILEKKMQEFSKKENFETAGEIRDRLESVKLLGETQNVTSSKAENFDVIAGRFRKKMCVISVFMVRDGRLSGKKENHLESEISEGKEIFLEEFIKKYYPNTSYIPEKIYVPFRSPQIKSIELWLQKTREKKIKFMTPRKRAREIYEIADKNAGLEMEQFEILNSQDAELDLAKALGISGIKRIEGFDISNLGTEDPVASCVSFKDGFPEKSRYRKFKMNTKGPNDFKMIQEVIYRRYKNKEAIPDLIVIDGGKGQLSSAVSSLKLLGINTPIISIAKKEELIFIPKREKPVTVPENALNLVRKVRDESHRFAVSFQRQRRLKRMKQ
jgi:excinuclease ABC subunit C